MVGSACRCLGVSGVDQEPLVMRSIATITRALKDTAGVSVGFMSTAQRRDALLQLATASAQMESLRLRLIATSGDVAADDGYRDLATWLAHHTRTDRTVNTRTARLAVSLDRGWPLVADGLASGEVNLAQAEVIVTGRACQVFCVSDRFWFPYFGALRGCSEVWVDAVWVGDGELSEGLVPVRGDLAFDETS